MDKLPEIDQLLPAQTEAEPALGANAPQVQQTQEGVKGALTAVGGSEGLPPQITNPVLVEMFKRGPKVGEEILNIFCDPDLSDVRRYRAPIVSIDDEGIKPLNYTRSIKISDLIPIDEKTWTTREHLGLFIEASPGTAGFLSSNERSVIDFINR